MTDIEFQASLNSAKLIARKHPDKPDTIIRRVQFSLRRTFTHEEAEWLGQVGIDLLNNLKARNLNKGEIPINGYHAKAEFSGTTGTATAEVDGLVAQAQVTGKEDQEFEEITFHFEAPCEAKFLVFLGLSLKEFVECDIKRSQQELPLGESSPGAKTSTFKIEDLGRDIRENLGKSLKKGESMTFEDLGNGTSATIEGTREES